MHLPRKAQSENSKEAGQTKTRHGGLLPCGQETQKRKHGHRKNARAWKDSFGMSVFLFILHDLH